MRRGTFERNVVYFKNWCFLFALNTLNWRPPIPVPGFRANSHFHSSHFGSPPSIRVEVEAQASDIAPRLLPTAALLEAKEVHAAAIETALLITHPLPFP